MYQNETPFIRLPLGFRMEKSHARNLNESKCPIEFLRSKSNVEFQEILSSIVAHH
jgi:hypothetical protein